MKSLSIFLLAGLFASTIGYLIKVPTKPTQPRIGTSGWVHIQKLMLPLFSNVCEESVDPLIVRLSSEFSFDATDFLKSDAIVQLQKLKSENGLLAKDEIFTETNPEHFNEFRIIYEVLYNAKDFDTFYKAACWARQNLNCGVFIDAIYLTVITRKDTERLSVPAPYELIPNYFIRKDFIAKASSIMAGEEATLLDSVRIDGNNYIIDTNNTDFFEVSEESRLAYFIEDIGLNSYFFLMKLKNMPWVDSELQRSVRYGEYVFHFMKQLLARYNLERYSNDLYEIDGIDWEGVDDTQYDSMLIYSNGNEFKPRMGYSINNNEAITSLKNIENNIATTVTHMRDGGYSKAAILNHLMDIMYFNNNSYINLAMQVINGESSNNRSPSVLEHYMTKLRDPILWKINKKIVDLVHNSMKVLTGYSKNQLYFPGVQVTNIDAKKMTTSFDNYEIDVTDAMKYGSKDPNFQIKISQSRLNHKPFAIKLNVTSLVIQKGQVKLYLGPKLMPGEINKNKNSLMLIDSFEVNLKQGINIITRTSSEINNLSGDFVPLRTVKQNVIDSEFGVNALSLKLVKSQIGFPSRLILPKGTSDGLPFQLFAIVAPYIKATPGGVKTNIEMNYDAIFSPGYPFDLDIDLEEVFNLPNTIVKDVIVMNKVESKNTKYGGGGYKGGKRWDAPDDLDDYDVPSQSLKLAAPSGMNKLGKFDIKSQKSKFGKKNEYKKPVLTTEIPVESFDIIKDFEFNKAYTTNNDNNIVVDKYYVSKDVNVNKNEDDELKNIVALDKTIQYDYAKKNEYKNPISDETSVKRFDIKKDFEFNKAYTKYDSTNDDNVAYTVISKNDNNLVVDKFITKDVKINKDEEEELKDITALDQTIHELEKESNFKIEPLHLLSSPKKRYPTIFNIVLKPFYREIESNEKVYE